VNRDDLQIISQLRLNEGRLLYDKKFYCGAYYLTGYAIECAFKSAICKQINEHDFPDKKLARDSFTHELEELLGLSGLRRSLEDAMKANPALELNWNIVKGWSEQFRYRHNITEPMARDLIDACNSDPNGVHRWLMTQW
jgi:hypothetical protein